MSYASDCACRIVEKSLERGDPHVVILTPSVSSGVVRQEVGAVLPPGSSCTGAVWRTPTGQLVSIKRFEDPVPAYERPFLMEVCNGGAALTDEERAHVLRWQEARAGAVPVLGI